jgi:peptidoglycan/xylan/chitin deacetylase (PgdA/CDA1 family)
VALCVIVTLEHLEWSRSPGSFQLPTRAGGYGPGPFPDVTAWSHREYGHRVGIFRVLDVLARHGVTPTIAMDVLTAEHYPFLVRHCLGRGAEIMAHGISVSRMITSRMSDEEERDYIQAPVQRLTRATGKAPAGWLVPESGESPRTPGLLAEARIRYVCDWVNDEQPYPLKVPGGNSRLAHHLAAGRRQRPLGSADRSRPVRRMIGDTCETLYRDGATTGRLLVLHLHPWLIGQPFRIGCLDATLGRIGAGRGCGRPPAPRSSTGTAQSASVTSAPMKLGTSVRFVFPTSPATHERFRSRLESMPKGRSSSGRWARISRPSRPAT